MSDVLHEAYRPIIEDGRGRFPEDLRVKAPRGAKAAIAAAAQLKHTSHSKYVRQALLNALASDGVRLRRGMVAAQRLAAQGYIGPITEGGAQSRAVRAAGGGLERAELEAGYGGQRTDITAGGEAERAALEQALGVISPYEEASRGGLAIYADLLGINGPGAQQAAFAAYKPGIYAAGDVANFYNPISRTRDRVEHQCGGGDRRS